MENEIHKKYNKEKDALKKPRLQRICAMFAGIIIFSIGATFAGRTIKNHINNVKLNASFKGNVEDNKIWVGTFQIAWNELIDYLETNIQFEDGNSKLADDLNKQSFTKDMLNEDSYYIAKGTISPKLKTQIKKDLKDKFNLESEIIDNINWNSNSDEYMIYSVLKKNFTFKTPFIERGKSSFGGSQETVKYFGLDASALEETFEQVSVLFYNSSNDFAVKISTKEGEEVILYRTDNVTNFQDTYSELENKSKAFTGRKNMIREKDELRIPFIKVSSIINYDELCNREIKGVGGHLKYAVQNVEFSMDNYGGNIFSEADINMYMCIGDSNREFNFTDKFVLYLKEEDKTSPYFALLVDSTDILVKK